MNAAEARRKDIRSRLVIVGVLFAFLSLNACASRPASALDPAGIPTIDRPRTFEALLRNVKSALDRGLLLRLDFYEEDNLRQYFGGQRITKSDNSTSRIVGFVSGFERIVEPMNFRGMELEGVTFAFQRLVDANNIPTAYLTISISSQTSIGFQSVTEIFGSGWRPAETRLLPPNQRVFPRTAEHGNSEIVYSATYPSWTWGADFEFSANASLSLAGFSITERSQP